MRDFPLDFPFLMGSFFKCKPILQGLGLALQQCPWIMKFLLRSTFEIVVIFVASTGTRPWSWYWIHNLSAKISKRQNIPCAGICFSVFLAACSFVLSCWASLRKPTKSDTSDNLWKSAFWRTAWSVYTSVCNDSRMLVLSSQCNLSWLIQFY